MSLRFDRPLPGASAIVRQVRGTSVVPYWLWHSIDYSSISSQRQHRRTRECTHIQAGINILISLLQWSAQQVASACIQCATLTSAHLRLIESCDSYRPASGNLLSALSTGRIPTFTLLLATALANSAKTVRACRANPCHSAPWHGRAETVTQSRHTVTSKVVHSIGLIGCSQNSA